MGTIRFQLCTHQKDKKGQSAIRIIYQKRGERRYFPTGLKLYAANWNIKTQRAVVLDKKQAKKLPVVMQPAELLSEETITKTNLDISNFERTIFNIEKRFSDDGIVYSHEMVIDQLKRIYKPLEQKEDPQVSVVKFIQEYTAGLNKLKEGTIKVYIGLANHIKAYEEQSKAPAVFKGITLGWLKGFEAFLTKEKTLMRKARNKKTKVPHKLKGMGNVTAAKQIATLKSIIKVARIEYKIEVNPDYEHYKASRGDGNFEVIALTQEELDAIYQYDLSEHPERLQHVRDVFCFSCATGLRYSDLKQFRWEHIRHGVIKMTAAKTGQLLTVPLNPISAGILAKYKGAAKPLPVISNDKTNVYLKELAKLVGIDEPVNRVRRYGKEIKKTFTPKHELVSIHMGRRTFVTLSLEKGMQAHEVMAITRHVSYASFKRYVNVTTGRTQAVMAKAWGAVPNENLKAV